MQLYLARHADAEFSAASDHQRPLSDLGHIQAARSGLFLKQNIGNNSVLIVCSDAKRTLTTAQIIQQNLSGETLIQPQKNLYHANSGDWCDVITEQHSCAHLVLVGHNPTISHLTQVLNHSYPQSFRPACVAHYRLEIAEDGLKLPAQFIDTFQPDAK